MSIDDIKKGVILIVDDNPTNLEILFDFLADYEFTVLVAEDGESAIARAEYAPPDLILLDILMPGIDGYETCRRLKANELTKDIPIIFMTALSDTVDKVKGLTLGAVDYITKPLQHEEILARIELHLKLRNLNKTLQAQNVLLEQEITERKRVEEELRHNTAKLEEWKNRYEAVIQASGQIIYDWDSHSNDIFYEGDLEKILGYSPQEMSGGLNRFIELIHPEDKSKFSEEINRVLSTKEPFHLEFRLCRKDGTYMTVENNGYFFLDRTGNIASMVGFLSDITEKKQLERQFLRAQRLESIGTIAGGIAHDLNNILTPILAAAQLLQLKLPNSDERCQQMFKTIESNAKRGAALVKQVLQFARGVEGKRTIVQVNHLFSEIEQIVKETFPKSIALSMNTKPEMWAVLGDATHLHQVLINLVVNARDAMPNGGRLSLSAENVFVDENYARMNLEANVGSYLLIRVADTGVGIPPEILDRIFEPFFTTKEVGKGTGLGLSTVIGIIKSHGGFVNVYSEVGKGTEFKVFLPAVEATVTLLGDNLELPKGNGELILVVDDEEPILDTTKIFLETYNYQVLMAKDGIEAIALYAQQKEEISLVLIDMMMPLMDGATTIRALQKMNPNVNIVAVSGLSASDKLVGSVGVKTFIPKPYTAKELLQALQNILGQELRDSVTDSRGAHSISKRNGRGR